MSEIVVPISPSPCPAAAQGPGVELQVSPVTGS